jgi:hypothetical protein
VGARAAAPVRTLARHGAGAGRPLPRRSAVARQVVRSVDESDVRQRLREVAEHAARTRVIFLGEQADVVAQREQPLEQPSRIFTALEQHVHDRSGSGAPPWPSFILAGQYATCEQADHEHAERHQPH